VQQGAEDSPEFLERFHLELGLVDIVAAQIARSIGTLVEFDDLKSAGREGLLDAARRFDDTRGVPFRAYANLRIRGAIVDCVRRQASLPRRVQELVDASNATWAMSEGKLDSTFDDSYPVTSPGAAEQQYANQLASMATAAALAMSAKSGDGPWQLLSEHVETPEEQVSKAEMFDLMRRSLDELDFVEAAVIRAYYFGGKSFTELATTLNVSRSWACRLHAQAMERLTKLIKASV